MAIANQMQWYKRLCLDLLAFVNVFQMAGGLPIGILACRSSMFHSLQDDIVYVDHTVRKI